MKTQSLEIGGATAILYGETREKGYLFLHGQMGCKEEGEAFARLACPKGYQVLAIDLPDHGQRRNRGEELTPWAAQPDIRRAVAWAEERWEQVSLRANSIGAYFAMLAFENPHHALLVSPILNMEELIRTMMVWAGVTEEQLREQGEIVTSFGQILSWNYLCWVREHPVHDWTCSVDILYGSGDTMTSRHQVKEYVQNHNAHLTVMEGGEHWFHTPEQLEVLREWEKRSI